MEESVNIVYDGTYGLIIGLLLTMIACFIFHWCGFFKLPEQKKEPLSFFLLLKGFACFLIAPYVIVPTLASLWFFVFLQKTPDAVTPSLERWLSLMAILTTFVIYLFFIGTLSRSQWESVIGQSLNRKRAFFIGMGSWFLAFPIVLALGSLAGILVAYFFEGQPLEQMAVKQLRRSLEEPLQFSLLTLCVVTIVPFLEETLFRGIFQSWLKQYLGRAGAIILASVVFALFHFSKEQGVTNIQLMISLFSLSCILGFLLEREKSIWAPIGLHSLFNGISTLVLFYQ